MLYKFSINIWSVQRNGPILIDGCRVSTDWKVRPWIGTELWVLKDARRQSRLQWIMCCCSNCRQASAVEKFANQVRENSFILRKIPTWCVFHLKTLTVSSPSWFVGSYTNKIFRRCRSKAASSAVEISRKKHLYYADSAATWYVVVRSPFLLRRQRQRKLDVSRHCTYIGADLSRPLEGRAQTRLCMQPGFWPRETVWSVRQFPTRRAASCQWLGFKSPGIWISKIVDSLRI
jgi:hypothetical protein